MRSFRDRDYLLTKEGLFFAVVGNLHPSDKVIAYLKYVPDEAGSWGRGKEKFKRVLKHYTIPSLKETFGLLKEKYPHYLHKDPVLNIVMSFVPVKYIKKHFKPEERLKEILNTSNRDELEQRVVELVKLISKESNVPLSSLGVTGSILINIHRVEFSDIDLIVYGKDNSYRVKEALLSLYQSSNSNVRKFSKREFEEWYTKVSSLYRLKLNDARKICERKWNRGVFDGTLFSVHPVKTEKEFSDTYDTYIFQPIGIVKIRATVVNAEDSIFNPAIYKISQVEVMEGPKIGSHVKEVVTYEGLYSDIAKEGEKIEVRGKLEKIINKALGTHSYRILVGSPEANGLDYLRLV